MAGGGPAAFIRGVGLDQVDSRRVNLARPSKDGDLKSFQDVRESVKSAVTAKKKVVGHHYSMESPVLHCINDLCFSVPSGTPAPRFP